MNWPRKARSERNSMITSSTFKTKSENVTNYLRVVQSLEVMMTSQMIASVIMMKNSQAKEALRLAEKPVDFREQIVSGILLKVLKELIFPFRRRDAQWAQF